MDSDPHAGPEQRIGEEAMMEFYSYVNIFEAKGLTYLLVMAFLVMFLLLIKYLAVPEEKDRTLTGRNRVD